MDDDVAFVFFSISVPLVVLGGLLLASWYLTKKTMRMKR